MLPADGDVTRNSAKPLLRRQVAVWHASSTNRKRRTMQEPGARKEPRGFRRLGTEPANRACDPGANAADDPSFPTAALARTPRISEPGGHCDDGPNARRLHCTSLRAVADRARPRSPVNLRSRNAGIRADGPYGEDRAPSRRGPPIQLRELRGDLAQKRERPAEASRSRATRLLSSVHRHVGITAGQLQ